MESVNKKRRVSFNTYLQGIENSSDDGSETGGIEVYDESPNSGEREVIHASSKNSQINDNEISRNRSRQNENETSAERSANQTNRTSQQINERSIERNDTTRNDNESNSRRVDESEIENGNGLAERDTSLQIDDESIFNETHQNGTHFTPFDIEASEERGYFVADEDYEEAKTGCQFNCVPKLEKWKEVEYDKIDIIIGCSRNRLWLDAKKEISMIKNNIDHLVIRGVDEILLQDNSLKVYKFLFGTNSNLYRVFEQHLGISPTQYLLFLRSFFLSCKNKQSVDALYTTFDINKEYYLDANTYNRLWRDIGDLSGSLATDVFWQDVETVVNKCMRCLFFDNSVDSHHTVAVDDDKLHYAYTRSSRFEGLKCCHHAKDARRGFTVHTAAYPASQVPIGAYFQREGESVQATYKRMMKKMFGNNGGDVMPNLGNVTLASDRGYWMPQFLFKDMLEAGANVEGTVKRVSTFFCFVLFC